MCFMSLSMKRRFSTAPSLVTSITLLLPNPSLLLPNPSLLLLLAPPLSSSWLTSIKEVLIRLKVGSFSIAAHFDWSSLSSSTKESASLSKFKTCPWFLPLGVNSILPLGVNSIWNISTGFFCLKLLLKLKVWSFLNSNLLTITDVWCQRLPMIVTDCGGDAWKGKGTLIIMKLSKQPPLESGLLWSLDWETIQSGHMIVKDSFNSCHQERCFVYIYNTKKRVVGAYLLWCLSLSHVFIDPEHKVLVVIVFFVSTIFERTISWFRPWAWLIFVGELVDHF